MQLIATFPKIDMNRRQATFAWPNGVVAETPIWNRWQQLPHDLEHFITESYVEPPYGFWALARQQAPFNSFTLVRGHWPPERVEWFRRVKRKHRDEMVQAEAIGYVASLANGELDLHADWSVIRRGLTKAYAIKTESAFARVDQRDLEKMVDIHRRVHRLWDDLPLGGALVVDWPSKAAPELRCEAAPSRTPAFLH